MRSASPIRATNSPTQPFESVFEFSPGGTRPGPTSQPPCIDPGVLFWQGAADEKNDEQDNRDENDYPRDDQSGCQQRASFSLDLAPCFPLNTSGHTRVSGFFFTSCGIRARPQGQRESALSVRVCSALGGVQT